MSISPSTIDQVMHDWRNAEHGAKTDIVKKWAGLLKCSYSKLYRQLPIVKRKRKQEAQRPEYRKWAEIVAQVKKRPPEEGGEISTDQAVELAIKAGHIPGEAQDVGIGTFDRIMREMGFSKKGKRHVRFQAEKPNEAHHFDASSSRFLYIHKEVKGSNGEDYVLRLHRPAKHYKNKPIPCDKLRPWLYGITDDHSGLFTARYTAAKGESMADSLSFIQHAWSEIGIPEQLLADQGVLKKGLPSSEFIQRLEVALPECMPYAKTAHGKIERPWRTVWQRFEKPFFALKDWQKFEITLSELNRQFSIFQSQDYNQRAHRFEKDITREQAWKRIQLHGGIVALPESALATVARRAKRKVDAAGLLQYPGGPYEVKGLHDAWVYVFEGVFEDKLIVQCIETGDKFEVRDFKPLNLGDYRAHPETPHQEAVAAGAELNIEGVLYAEEGKVNEKVISIPIRREEKEVVDIFNVSCFASLSDAWAEFTGIAGSVKDIEDRAEVEAVMLESKLDKKQIIDFAQEVSAAIQTERTG